MVVLAWPAIIGGSRLVATSTDDNTTSAKINKVSKEELELVDKELEKVALMLKDDKVKPDVQRLINLKLGMLSYKIAYDFGFEPTDLGSIMFTEWFQLYNRYINDPRVLIGFLQTASKMLNALTTQIEK